MADPIVIVATPGDPAANSYDELAAADAYFAARLGSTPWFDQGAEERKKAMLMGVRNIDSQLYRGARSSATQALQWPRTGTYLGGQPIDAATIPAFVKYAEFEEAFAVIVAAGADVEKDPMAYTGLEQFRALGVGDIKLDMRDLDPDSPSRNLLSAVAFRLLRAYLITDLLSTPAAGARSFRIVH